MNEDIVLDASVLIQAYVREPDTARVQTLLQGLEAPQSSRLHVPVFCLLECTNVLWKHIRFHNMPVTYAKTAIGQMTSLPLIVHPATDLLSRALTVGLEHELAIYDALYIALAEQLACPLVTADERQADTADATGVVLKPLADFPEFAQPE